MCDCKLLYVQKSEIHGSSRLGDLEVLDSHCPKSYWCAVYSTIHQLSCQSGTLRAFVFMYSCCGKNNSFAEADFSLPFFPPPFLLLTPLPH